MKKFLLFSLVALIALSCSTSRQIEKAVSVGNYDQAISYALDKLRTNKDKKGKADFIIMLHEAYSKATARDLDNIDFLKKDNNPENYIRIYDAYVALDNRQERIKHILPLYVNGKEVRFKLSNYHSQIIKAKNSASEQLYVNATSILKSKLSNKTDYRFAYDQFRDIEDINPNYKDVRQLIEVAHQKGADFVLVEMINDTRKVIPQRLEDDLLNFSTYGLNNLWTVYHNNPTNEVKYDYNMRVNLREINTSPEQIRERQIIKEKQIVDGKKLLLDEQCNQVKDSLGNAIEVDNLKTVRCEFYEFTQFKAVKVAGNVEYYNLNTKQLADAFPVDSEFVFEHIYADARGDRRALETTLLPFLNNRRVPFPTEEQMIFDTGEDLKLQLKNIINSYSLN
ncbi:hypothetical protein [Tamlana crocina]|uniref:Lipoprotein n=1 Tax=Tamlana crocina TaxID=393006 RepID=A0ABX1DAX1_9FLAO|nr:hypothetical protein [Tamlana crocina]NJX15510.1 hypothetical protein [Tamlana crocina]